MADLSAPPAVSIARLTHRFAGERRTVLDIAALEIESGTRVGLIGASGAGKTTLLRLIDGRLRGWTGVVSVFGHRLDPRRPPPRGRRCESGFVFQEFALVEPASVYQNVLNGRLGRAHAIRSLVGRFQAEDEAAAERAMRDVGIVDLAARRADRLSGGQRQRVAIARMLAQEPRLILADEPISNLDPVNAETILGLLRSLAEKRGATLLLSSHQPRIVAPHVDRFVALDEGRVVFDGSPDALHDERLAAIYAAERVQEGEAAA
jgi:phosphonate transport system ATP-binding protein